MNEQPQQVVKQLQVRLSQLVLYALHKFLNLHEFVDLYCEQ